MLVGWCNGNPGERARARALASRAHTSIPNPTNLDATGKACSGALDERCPCCWQVSSCRREQDAEPNVSVENLIYLLWCVPCMGELRSTVCSSRGTNKHQPGSNMDPYRQSTATTNRGDVWLLTGANACTRTRTWRKRNAPFSTIQSARVSSAYLIPCFGVHTHTLKRQTQTVHIITIYNY